MLRIRIEQLQVFERATEAAAERRMVEHAAKFFPAQAKALGLERLVDVIRDGRRRAARYGLVRERDVFLFIDLMFALSFRFDVHPKVPWARRILTNASMTPPQRIERLLRTTQCFFENISAHTAASGTSGTGARR